MNKKKIIAIILSAICTIGVFVGCDMEENNDDKQADQTQQITKRASDAVGMPNVTNFFEKKMLKRIIEDNDNPNLITYVYTQSAMTGKYEYIGEAIGHGVPYSTSYTNPEYVAKSYQSGYAILPQPDPNGIYKPDDAKGTWVMLIDSKTKEAKPTLMEPDVITSQFKLRKEVCDPSSLPSDY